MKTLTFLSIFVVILNFVLSQFVNQFVGKDLNDIRKQNKCIDFCESKECLTDANLLFFAASQNSTIKPCENFLEFSLGNFIKFVVLNDRYLYKGLQSDVEDNQIQRYRKILSAKSKPNETRIFKVIKNYFSKCVNSSKKMK